MLHGINHNMFGMCDPAQCGTITLAEIDARLQALGLELGARVESFQTSDVLVVSRMARLRLSTQSSAIACAARSVRVGTYTVNLYR